eukprot:jgi/Orpsp1_1/1190616/evm.model.d7180000080137.1
MNLKFIFTIICFELLFTFSFANDCEDIQKFIKKKNYNSEDIKNCRVDDNGKVIY